MAGGEGTRLRPITCGKPKPMIDVMGRPVMEHIIELMKNAGITDIAVTLMYMPQVITDYFGDGSRFGVNLQYFIEETPLGTAGSVKNAEEFLDGDFIIISGDCLTDIDINAAIDFHTKNNSVATLVLSRVDTPLEYGVVVTDDNGKIIRFLEKPSWSEVFSDTANTGIYIINPSVLNMINLGEKYDFSQDLFPRLLSDEKPMYGYVAEGYWCDIGDLNAYKKCHFDILDKKVNVRIDAEETEPGVYVGKGAQIQPNTLITPPCYIGSRSIIHSGAKILPYSIIGSDCKVYDGASIKQTVLHRNIILGRVSQLRGCTIADGVYVGTHSMVLENSVIGEKTHIGEMCEIKNNIKIWPNKNISNETVVSENLVWGDNFSRKLFGENGVSGEINVDITPEYATRLGATFGAMKKGGKISVSSGGAGALDMLKSAFVSGLLSSGAGVFDFGSQPLPVTRRAIAFYGLGGGIHIDLTERGGEERLVISFIDGVGADISREDERKLETLFMREDFTRCEPQDIKQITNLFDYKMYYVREILNEFCGDKLNMSVVLSGSDEMVGAILFELGAKAVSSGKNIINAKIDNFGQRLTLIDEENRVISGELYIALVCQILLKSGQATVVAPLSSSSIIENLAIKYNGRVIRCKTGKNEIMSTMAKNNALTQFRMMYDGGYALVKICSFLKQNNLRLCDLINEIPEIHIIEREVECDFSKKGRVIRSIADGAERGKTGYKVELKEGVKILNENGWVLIIPHPEKPICRVISEGQSAEFAEELCNFYIKEVETFSKK